MILPAVGPAPAKMRTSASLLSLAKTASLKSRPHRQPGKATRTNDVFTAGSITGWLRLEVGERQVVRITILIGEYLQNQRILQKIMFS